MTSSCNTEVIVTVWNTTQSSQYEAKPPCDNIGGTFGEEPRRSSGGAGRNDPHGGECRAEPRKSSVKPPQNGSHGGELRGEPQQNIFGLLTKNMLGDSDTLLMFALIMILMRENADHKLILSLLFVMLM